uniref:CRAL-TRIO domain-containing protein n=1 Tax=Heterorhabditis bacteriophora TaxID=37862 RepID=A0A1I7XQW0_HETBA
MIETHYPHIDDLTDHHKEKIAELRHAVAGSLKKYPEYNTEFSLLRWLMGWDYNIEVILPKIQKAIDILISLGMGDISMESPSEVNCRIRGLFDGAEYFPGGLMGQDDEGNVIYMQEITATHPRSLAKAGSVSELFRLCIMETEMAFKLVRHSEAKTGEKLGVKLIVDLDGFNMDLLYTPTLSVYLQLLTQLQAIFPDFTKKIYLINCPLMMKTVYAMIQPVLSKQTRDKICFLGNNWKEELISNVGNAK